MPTRREATPMRRLYSPAFPGAIMNDDLTPTPSPTGCRGGGAPSPFATSLLFDANGHATLFLPTHGTG